MVLSAWGCGSRRWIDNGNPSCFGGGFLGDFARLDLLITLVASNCFKSALSRIIRGDKLLFFTTTDTLDFCPVLEFLINCWNVTYASWSFMVFKRKKRKSCVPSSGMIHCARDKKERKEEFQVVLCVCFGLCIFLCFGMYSTVQRGKK